MKTLQLEARPYHEITIVMNDNKEKTFKIPSELTVSEIEYLLEVQSKLEEVHNEPTVNDGSAQLRIYWKLIFAQLEVIFKHFQPEITSEYLQDNLLQTDAISILQFFSNNRYIKTTEQKKVLAMSN